MSVELTFFVCCCLVFVLIHREHITDPYLFWGGSLSIIDIFEEELADLLALPVFLNLISLLLQAKALWSGLILRLGANLFIFTLIRSWLDPFISLGYCELHFGLIIFRQFALVSEKTNVEIPAVVSFFSTFSAFTKSRLLLVSWLIHSNNLQKLEWTDGSNSNFKLLS